MIKYQRLIGCCFPCVLYIPYGILIIHDGTRFRFLDPNNLYNIARLTHNHITFSIPKVSARRYQWVQ